MPVVFLNRTRRQGSKGVVGPVTLIEYNIVIEGTPVSHHDADALLAMTEPPCCGHDLPFDGEVKVFGVHIPTPRQLERVPDWLWNAEPIVVEEEKRGRRKVKTYTRPEPEPAKDFEPMPVTVELKEEDESSEEVI